jgi:hypothetical protein
MPGLPRIAAVAALLALTGTAATADAAPRRTMACRLVTDAAGDTSSSVTPADPFGNQLDILSADVATNTHDLTVVLRLPALTAADPANPQGRVYEFDFTAREKNFIVMGSLLPGGNTFGVYLSDSRFEEGQSGARSAIGIGEARGVLDLARKEVRMTAPLEVFAPHASLSRNVVLYALSAFTYRAHGYSLQGAGGTPSPVRVTLDVGIGADEAWGRKAYYQSQERSCLRVG